MSDAAEDDRWVVLAFVEKFLGDQQHGRPGALEDYLACWPGHAATVEREYRHLVASGLTGTTVEPFVRSKLELPERVGPFLIDAEIGRGGQAVVYRARDERLMRDVALKVLRLFPGEGSRAALERFRREAVAASKLAHPRICGVYEIGEAEGLAYVAMPFVPGTTLARVIAGGSDSADQAGARRQDLRWIQRFFADAARALHAVHEVGVLHRDIKPGNLMVTPEGHPMILDFGLAQDLEMDGQRLTLSGDILGTPSYLAPEQISGTRIPLDPRTDVWALGVTLYETLSGKRPFDAATRAETYRAILTKEPASLWRRTPGVSKDLATIVLTAIEKDTDRRYQSALLFAEDLERALGGEVVLARPAGPVVRTWRVIRRHPLAAGSLLVAVLSLVAGLLVSLVHLHAANEAREDVARAQRRDRERLDQMRGLAQQFLSGLTYDVRAVPSLAPFRERLSEEVLLTLERVSAESEPDPGLIAQRLSAYRGRAAFLASPLVALQKDAAGARQMLSDALGEAERARRRFPSHEGLLLEAVSLSLSLSQLLTLENKWDEVLAGLGRLAPDLESLAALEMTAKVLRLRCIALEQAGDAKSRLGRAKESLAHFTECLALRRLCLESKDTTSDDTVDTSLIALKVAQVCLQIADAAGCRAALDEALVLAEDYAETRPASFLAQDRLADIWRYRAYVATAERDVSAAKLAWRLSAWFQERACGLGSPSAKSHQETSEALDKLRAIATKSGDQALLASEAASRIIVNAELAPLDALQLVDRARELRAQEGAGAPEAMRAYLWLRRAALMSKRGDPRVLAELSFAARDAGDRIEARRAAAAALDLFGTDVPADLEARLTVLRGNSDDRN